MTDALIAAQATHDAACKCGVRASISGGRDGPSLTLLVNALDVAVALDREYRAKGPAIVERAAETRRALAAFRMIAHLPEDKP